MINTSKKIWLTVLIIMTILMIAIGGVTRMTRSGLSIVEWKPITGFIPPMNEEEWNQQFQLYKESPEYEQVNDHFGVDDYKKIFFWEYFHRLWGRLIFFVSFFVGVFLWLRKRVEFSIVIYGSLLIAAQGLLGWIMVKSGLNKDPMVSPFLLVLHFLSANVVLFYFYYHLKKFNKREVVQSVKAKWLFYALGVILILQVAYGGLVSGFRAGYAFNTWPLMADSFFPPGGLRIDPLWLNLFENPAALQWIHRWMAFLVILLLVLFSKALGADKGKIKGALIHMHSVVGLQIVLGVLNILFVVPIYLASIHQIMAVMILLGYVNIWLKVRFQN